MREAVPPGPRRLRRRIAALALPTVATVAALLLVLAAAFASRALYVVNLRVFAGEALDQFALQARQYAERIEAQQANLLLRRRIPSSDAPDDTQALRDALGERPPTLDSLEVRIGHEHIRPKGWSDQPATGEDGCAIPRQERSLWLARHLLQIDLCAEISRVASAHPNASVAGRYAVIVQPLQPADSEHSGVLETRHALSGLLQRWAPHSRAYFLGLALQLVTLVMLAAGGWWLVIRRIRAMQRQLDAASRREPLWVPARTTRRLDEIGQLEHMMRRALRGAAIHQRHLHRENDILVRVRRFIAHEIRNPLQSLMTLNAESAIALSYLRRIKYAVDEVLEDAAAEDTRDVEERDAADFVHRWVDSLKTSRDEHLVAFTKPAATCMVRVNFEALEDALDHICSNAQDFRVTGSYIEVRVGRTSTHCMITIRNLGPQIPEHMLPLIFSYGVTTRAHPAQHLGQGLFRANSLVSRMNGSVRAQNVPDGVEFTITVPLLESAKA